MVSNKIRRKKNTRRVRKQNTRRVRKNTRKNTRKINRKINRRQNTRRKNTRRKKITRFNRKNKINGGMFRQDHSIHRPSILLTKARKLATKVAQKSRFVGSKLDDKVIEFIRNQFYLSKKKGRQEGKSYEIGEGGNAKVYKYTDGKKEDVNKCVKVSEVAFDKYGVNDNEIKIMERIMTSSSEVKTVKLFKHFHEPHKDDEDGDVRLYFIIMERINGLSLLDIIKMTTTPLKDRVDIAVSLFNSLQMLHRIGISHNDLTSSNIIVSTVEGKNVSVVIDFGEGRFIDVTGKFDTNLGGPMGNSGNYAIGSSNNYPGDLYSFCLIMLMLFLANNDCVRNQDTSCKQIIEGLIGKNEEKITQELNGMGLQWVDENAKRIIIKLISQICSADLSITLDGLNQFMKTLAQIFTDLKGLVP